MSSTEVVPADVIDVPSVASLSPAKPSTNLVRAAAPVSDIEAAFREYTTLCDRLLDDTDYQRIGKDSFRKKSAWRKLAVAFGVSTRLVSKDYDRDDRGRIIRAEVIMRAEAPNGRFMEGMGACDAFERCCDSTTCKKAKYSDHTCCNQLSYSCTGFSHFSHASHDIPATAMTRATNRACADLFGMGEVSAEEVTGDNDPAPAASSAPPRQAQAPIETTGRAAPPARPCSVCGQNTRRPSGKHERCEGDQ